MFKLKNETYDVGLFTESPLNENSDTHINAFPKNEKLFQSVAL